MHDPSLTPYVVRGDDTLEEAMVLIEENKHRTVVVVDDRDVVVGTLSDGDVRKAILDHRLLSIPVEQVMNTNFISLRPEQSDQAGALFQSEHIFIIPLIDDAGQLVGLARAYD